jgi:hypothetical protein
MTLDSFKRTIRQAMPPDELPPALAGLWWAAKGDWNRAHVLVQDDPSRDTAWVHAHLHRVEGDLGNANYWYRKAGRAAASEPLEAEWDAIATALLASAKSTRTKRGAG